MISVSRVEPVGLAFTALRAEADGEDYPFVARLEREWVDGTHRFERAGEALFGVFAAGELVAVGALVQDPFAGERGVGRVRHIYVRNRWRRHGVGTLLIERLVAFAQGGFTTLHLRAHSPEAAVLYERLGFSVSADPNATHELHLSETPASSSAALRSTP